MPILGLKSCIKLNLVKRIDYIKLDDDEKNKFIKDNLEIFTGLGCFPDEYTIQLKHQACPKASPARKVPFILKDRLKTTLKNLVEKGIISPVDQQTSEWVNNIAIVEKRDKSLRICLDPKELNNNMLRDYYEIPTLDEIKPKLANKKFFSLLDLKDGFWHVKLAEESCNLCTFNSPFGLNRFNHMPFGIKSAPEIFIIKYL